MSARELIAREQAKCEAATSGPWSVPHFARPESGCDCKYVLCESYMGCICTMDVDNGLACGDGGNDGPPLAEAQANGVFIASARVGYPSALKALDEIEAKLEDHICGASYCFKCDELRPILAAFRAAIAPEGGQKA